MKKEKYTIEACSCCQKEHGNPDGWILRNRETGLPEYHLDLSKSTPEIGKLPGNKEQKYNLGGCVLEGDGKSGWIDYICWQDKEGANVGRIEVFWGKTWIEHDTLIMGAWKISDRPREGHPQTAEEVDTLFASLPKWDQTKYFVKVADIGMSGLMDCQTGEPAPPEIAEVVMTKLGFKKATVEKAA